MNAFLTRWAIAIGVCVFIAWAGADGAPSDDQAAQDVEADRIEAITAATAKEQ